MANGSSATPTKHSATTNMTASGTVTALRPRPAPPTSVFNPDPKAVASWWQHAEAFANGEPLDHHANHCFSDGAA